MGKRASICFAIFAFSSLLMPVKGQERIVLDQDQFQRRLSDSTLAVKYLESARNFLSDGRDDSAAFCLGKSLNLASSEGFQVTEAACYELLADLYDSYSDWEEMLRNYLRSVSIYAKLGDRANEARVCRIIAGEYFTTGIYKKSAEYSEKEFGLYDERDMNLKAAAAEKAGSAYFFMPLDSLSVNWYNEAIRCYRQIGDEDGILRCDEQTGALYIQMGSYGKALDKYRNILPVYLSEKNYRKAAAVYNQLGFINFRNKNPEEALNDFSSAASCSEQGGQDDFFLTDIWSNMAICQQNLGNQKEMLRCFGLALQYAKNSGRTDEAARINRILASVYFNKGDNYHAELYCQDCIDAARESNAYNILQLCYRDYSEVLEKGNDFVKALEYYEKHLNLRDSLNYASRLSEQEAADRLARFESAEQRLKTELSDEEIRTLEIKNLRAESARKENELMLLQKQQELDRSEKERLAQLVDLEKERFELNRREQEVRSLRQQQRYDSLSLRQKDVEAGALKTANQLLETEKREQQLRIEKEKQIRKMAVGIGFLMLLVAVMILAGLISTRRKNRKLAESKRHIEKINIDLENKNIEVLKQKDIIEQKNLSITDSIQYASRIQAAVLPPAGFLSDWELENFILYKPKDIVSGDFYWGVKKKKKIIVAAGDCTGHGVPGAFMSMLGHAFLDEIVNTREIGNAASVLNILRDEIINTLKQKGTAGETRDGMDISLCIIDREAGKINFAGANNPLYLIRNGKMIKHQADRMPIGIHFISFTPFTNQIIDIQKGDYIYLFSDGYADQFGGDLGKKFMYKPFQDLLLKNHSKPMEMQKEILDTTFEKWKGNRDQVDDVLVIGIRL